MASDSRAVSTRMSSRWLPWLLTFYSGYHHTGDIQHQEAVSDANETASGSSPSSISGMVFALKMLSKEDNNNMRIESQNVNNMGQGAQEDEITAPLQILKRHSNPQEGNKLGHSMMRGDDQMHHDDVEEHIEEDHVNEGSTNFLEENRFGNIVNKFNSFASGNAGNHPHHGYKLKKPGPITEDNRGSFGQQSSPTTQHSSPPTWVTNPDMLPELSNNLGHLNNNHMPNHPHGQPLTQVSQRYGQRFPDIDVIMQEPEEQEKFGNSDLKAEGYSNAMVPIKTQQKPTIMMQQVKNDQAPKSEAWKPQAQNQLPFFARHLSQKEQHSNKALTAFELLLLSFEATLLQLQSSTQAKRKQQNLKHAGIKHNSGLRSGNPIGIRKPICNPFNRPPLEKVKSTENPHHNNDNLKADHKHIDTTINVKSSTVGKSTVEKSTAMNNSGEKSTTGTLPIQKPSTLVQTQKPGTPRAGKDDLRSLKYEYPDFSASQQLNDSINGIGNSPGTHKVMTNTHIQFGNDESGTNKFAGNFKNSASTTRLNVPSVIHQSEQNSISRIETSMHSQKKIKKSKHSHKKQGRINNSVQYSQERINNSRINTGMNSDLQDLRLKSDSYVPSSEERRSGDMMEEQIGESNVKSSDDMVDASQSINDSPSSAVSTTSSVDPDLRLFRKEIAQAMSEILELAKEVLLSEEGKISHSVGKTSHTAGTKLQHCGNSAKWESMVELLSPDHFVEALWKRMTSTAPTASNVNEENQMLGTTQMMIPGGFSDAISQEDNTARSMIAYQLDQIRNQVAEFIKNADYGDDSDF